jgi:mannose-6-phosphate isomerase-like protein (cupin superfamily)
MGIQVINPKEIALREKKRTVVMNTRKLHAWVHYYPNPGDHDDMHCHNEDQVFTCFEGECTMHFPDGTTSVLKPGMAALITGGSFYKLENTGTGHMILMGHRSGNQDNVMIIDYVTRQDIRKNGGPKVRNRAPAEEKPCIAARSPPIPIEGGSSCRRLRRTSCACGVPGCWLV